MSLQRALVSQFHHPHGALGRVAGWVMARRASNLERNRLTVEVLDIEPADRVLELGPGPGVTLGLLLERAHQGHVVGVDHSEAMLTQARSRNQAAVRAGRLTLIRGSFTDLPDLPGPFDKMLAVNALQFDAMIPETVARIVDLLKPGGKLAITFQPRGTNPTDQQAQAFGERVADLLKTVGITDSRIELLPLEPVCAVCVLAAKR